MQKSALYAKAAVLEGHIEPQSSIPPNSPTPNGWTEIGVDDPTIDHDLAKVTGRLIYLP